MGFWSLSCGRVYKELDRILCAAVRGVEDEMQTEITFSSTPPQLWLNPRLHEGSTKGGQAHEGIPVRL